MSAPLEKNVDYPLLGGLAVEPYPPLSSTYRPIPCFTAPRVFFGNDPIHVARLVRRDLALEAALRVNGFTIPMLDEDQDRR